MPICQPGMHSARYGKGRARGR